MKNGQETSVIITNNADHAINGWAYMTGSNTESTPSLILWSGGTPPTITNTGKDLIIFKNINGKVYGRYEQDFRSV